MYFKQFLNDECGCCSYFVASRQTNEAVVVDPEIGVQQYIDLAEQRGYSIKFVLDTHIHADHVSGARALAAETGAEICMHESSEALFDFQGLRDGETIPLGQLNLRILHTPGHRPESISVLVINTDRTSEPSMVLTGDSIFVGDVGRPDFGGERGVHQQYQSIHRLLELEDYVEVFPAHFEGSCGREMCGRSTSTIGFERRFNPLLQLSEGQFNDTLTEPTPRPLNMRAIVETNLGIADDAWASPTGGVPVDSIELAEFGDWITSHEPVLLDVREFWEFKAGHIPGAISIPQAELAERLSEIPANKDVLTICLSGVRSMRSARFLKKLGNERIVNLTGGTAAWIEAGNPVERTAG